VILTSRNKSTRVPLLEDDLIHMQFSKKPGFSCFQTKSSSQMKTTLLIIAIITEKQDELNVSLAKGSNKIYFLQNCVILKITTEKAPGLFCRESMLKGKIDA